MKHYGWEVAYFSIILIHALTDEEDLFDVLEEISSLESRYYQIGMGLRLKPKDLQSIDKEDSSRALSTMVEMWLQQQYNVQRHGPPTWQMLVKAVDSPAGGNDHTLAKKIASKHPASKYIYIELASSPGHSHHF